MGEEREWPPPEKSAEVIDLNQTSPSWSFVGSMQFARRQMNATLLPDGKVLVTGGTSAPGFNDPTRAVHAAELWDPANPMQWTTLASSLAIPRIYHSTAVLLPDGRVLSMGGNGDPQKIARFTHRRICSSRWNARPAHDQSCQRRPASATDRPSSSNVRRRNNFKGHDAETLLGDPCFQHEPVHQHVELFAGPQLEASTLRLLPEPLLLLLPHPVLRLPDTTCSSSSTTLKKTE